MRILMIGRDVRRMTTEVVDNAAAVERCTFSRSEVVLKSGDLIHCRQICDMGDVETLRGLRYDLVVEHGSFRGPLEVLHHVRRLVLRS